MPALIDEDGIAYVPKEPSHPSLASDNPSRVPPFPNRPTGLAQCPYCSEPVFRMGLETSSWSTADFDWRPWCVEDEEIPKGLTTAQKRKWINERPYQLGLAVLHFQSGTYRTAMSKATQKRKPEVMYRHHWCQQKEEDLYGLRVRQNDTIAATVPSGRVAEDSYGYRKEEPRTEPLRTGPAQAEGEVHLRVLRRRSRRG